MTDDCLVAVRDPNGFRPLVIGRMKGRGVNGTDGFCIASETCALDMCEFVQPNPKPPTPSPEALHPTS